MTVTLLIALAAAALAFVLGRQYGRGEVIAALILLGILADDSEEAIGDLIDSARASQMEAAREGRQ
jgi:hypothetical protein